MSDYDIETIIDLMSEEFDKETMKDGLKSFLDFLNNNGNIEKDMLKSTARVLTSIFTHAETKEDKLLALQAILNSLNKFGIEKSYSKHFIKFGFPSKSSQAFETKYENEWDGNLRLLVISALNLISIYQPEELGKSIDILPFFNALHYFKDVENIKLILQIIDNIVVIHQIRSHSQYINRLLVYLKSDNQEISQQTLLLISSLFEIGDLSKVNPEIVKTILYSLNKFIKENNEKFINKCYECITCLSHYSAHWDIFQSTYISFMPALHDDKIYNTITQLCIYLLPQLHDYPYSEKAMKKSQPHCSNPKQYAKMIKNDVEYLLLNMNHITNKLLIIYALILQELTEYLIPTNILCALSSFSNSPPLVTTVLKIMTMRIKQQKEILEIEAITILMNASPKENKTFWYISHLEPLLHIYNIKSQAIEAFKTTDFGNLSEILEFSKEISPQVLFKDDSFSDLVKSKITPNEIDEIISFLKNKLKFMAIPVLVSKFDVFDPVGLSRLIKRYKTPNNELLEIPIISTCASIFWYARKQKDGLNDETLKNIMHTSQIYNLIKLDDFNKLDATEKGYALLFFSGNEEILPNKCFQVYISQNQTKFLHLNDNILQMAAQGYNEMDDINEITPINIGNCIPELGISQYPNKRNLLNDPLKRILDLLKFVHDSYPNKDMHFEEFEQIVKKLSSPYSLITCFSPQQRIVTDYPFLFSLDLRKIVYFTNILDISSALNRVNEYIYSKKPTLCNRYHATVIIRRDHLWDDGLLLLKTYGQTPVFLDFQFAGEEGFGIGPMNEFFFMMSKEFTKTSLNMWLNDNSDSEYAFRNGIGLIPSPEKNTENFAYFGVFCAKALQLHTIIPIPLSLAFFKLVMGERLTFEDIGYESRIINSKENRLGYIDIPFVLPGTEKELIPNGKNIITDESNVDQFLDLLRDSLSGSLWKENIEAFKRGFYTILRKGYENMLSPTEFQMILIGEVPQLKYDELKEHVKIGSGFTDEDEEIEWLFDILSNLSPEDTSLFILFLTGNKRLPIGGISSLNPKISVALKEEKGLPTASTCTSYLKISRYTSKDQLQKDLLFAIQNCNTFDFS